MKTTLFILTLFIVGCTNTASTNSAELVTGTGSYNTSADYLKMNETAMATPPAAGSELEIYKKILRTADSLKKIGQIGIIDTISLFVKAKEIDKKHPVTFFELAGDYLSRSDYNEAAFTYYLALLRFRYYNSANPDYKAGGDGALLSSFGYILGEPVNMYLKADVDNFISVIKRVVDYYENNDFVFFPKDKNPGKFNAQAESYHKMILELETNKEKFKKEWAAELKTQEENIDNLLKKQND